jgi:hypothetical protein
VRPSIATGTIFAFFVLHAEHAAAALNPWLTAGINCMHSGDLTRMKEIESRRKGGVLSMCPMLKV